ncbi:MAG: RimK family alpha-L-glutamate ligase [Bdellovibrionales bacterium]|nr:RimK family alpha-L-glutamate ligase [Bdellovibrionales bacterium]
MRLAVLTRNRSLHSIRRLLQEASKRGVQLDTINPLECQLIVDGGESRLVVGAQELPWYDAVLPRIGASITQYGLAVVKQFEMLGMFTVNSSLAIAESRDKFRALQLLNQAGLCVPPTVLTRSQRSLRSTAKVVGGVPVIAKLLQGTQGVGVMLLHTPASFQSVVETLWDFGVDVFVQQYLKEGAGSDYRAFVVGNRVVAAMQRTASRGEFRSNIHRGGEGSLVRLPIAYQRAAVRAAHVFGLEIAGVDMMESKNGPAILEVNSSPGFEGIERATGLNIAGEIVSHLVHLAKKSKRTRRRQR